MRLGIIEQSHEGIKLRLYKNSFSIDFVFQQTVRGKLCNVFESLRTDYTPPEMVGNYQSVFRYFFAVSFI